MTIHAREEAGTSVPLANFKGSDSHTFEDVELSVGSYTIEVELFLENDDGDDTATDSIDVTVSSTIDEIDSLSFSVTGSGTATYVGKLTYQIVDLSTDGIIAEGNLGDSAAVFSDLALPTSVSDGQSLRLQEPIQIKVNSAGTITITVSVTANGYNHSPTVPFTASLK